MDRERKAREPFRKLHFHQHRQPFARGEPGPDAAAGLFAAAARHAGLHLAFTWPTNPTGLVLQRNNNLTSTNWVNVTNPATVSGTNRQIIISPLTGPGSFFRLLRP